MKFLKKNLKLIITIIGVILLTAGITVYATTYQASSINYTRNNTTMNVANALDDLYSKATELNTLKANINQTDATASDILNGKKAYTTEGLITGVNLISGSKLASSTGVLDVTTNFRPKQICVYLTPTSSTPGVIIRAIENNGTIFAEGYGINNTSATPYYLVCSTDVEFSSTGFIVSNLTGENNIFVSRTYNWFAIK